MKKVGQKIDRFLETRWGKLIFWAVEIAVFVGVIIAFLCMAGRVIYDFTPAQMGLFKQLIYDDHYKLVMLPQTFILMSGMAGAAYIMTIYYRWSYSSDIKKLKAKIQELEAYQE
ncbi:hypothetical protein ABH897_005582 [Paenibacillus sp. RC73]|uniref:hypothetical protein n=1 Tax=Paenibacillus sp. RC73 TaxID=3156250 RepID=UPI003839B6E9